jgi:hypothetical protein
MSFTHIYGFGKGKVAEWLVVDEKALNVTAVFPHPIYKLSGGCVILTDCKEHFCKEDGEITETVESMERKNRRSYPNSTC